MPARPIPRDALLAAAFVTWALLEVVTGTVHGTVGVNVVAAVAGTGALAWRRSATAPAALLCAGGLAFKTAWGLQLDGLALLAAILVASYSVGRHLPSRPALTTTIAVLLLAWLSLFGLPAADQTIANYPFIALWVCGPALAGAALRVQIQRAAQAADHLARAEMEQEQHTRSAVQSERGRIARELHDTVAHAVSVMVLHAGAVRSRLPDDLASEQEALLQAEEAGRRAIAELRRLLGVLRSDDATPLVQPQPTMAGIDELVEESRRVGLEVRLTVEGLKPALEPAIEVSAYRILQEALTNVRKHAAARTVSVRVGYDDDWVRLRVADDGVGSPDGEPGPGHGLVGIRERVEVYGGLLSLTSPATGGFVMDVALPVVRG
jgi:signal transduction histidine kinase